MMKAENKYSAFDTALYYLSFKNRTQKEIKDKLIEKGYSESEIDKSISKLLEYGYIDDSHYTFLYIKSNINKKGIKLIKNELINKGILKEVVDEQYSVYLENEISDDVCNNNDFEYNTVNEIFERRFYSIDLTDEKNLRKVNSYFIRRGFKYEIVNKVIKNHKE